MKKILLLCLLLSFDAAAQSSDLASGITGVSDSEIEVQKNEEAVVDSRSPFSFLNFSFVKKAKNLLPSNDEARDNILTTDETPLQRITRQAEEGDLDAQLTLGYVYLYGQNGVKPDHAMAFKYYQMAAAQNDPVALNNLGSLYFNGIGTEKNYRKAAELFSQAAAQGSDEAAVNLAFIYLSGDNTFSDYVAKAVKLLEQAADAGNNTAKFMFGYANYMGFETPQNDYKAVALIRQAADAEFDEAQYILGLMYLNGRGISQNYGNAVRYLRAAAAQGNLAAMSTLANILAEGKLYPKNLPQAYIMYNIAAVYNVPGAAVARDAVEKQLRMEQLLPAQEEAEKFQAKPSELTTYVRQTFGTDIRRYIDSHINQAKEIRSE